MPLIILVLLLMPFATHAGEWVTDSENSRLEFVASYTGVEMPGSFDRFAVVLRFDPRMPGDGSLVVTVDVASVDMGGDDMNQAVTGDAWFDVGAFASASFSSEDISMVGEGRYAAAGTLELKGVRKAVTVPFVWKDEAGRASMQGELILQRLDFNIGTGTWSATDEVAGDVRVRFDVSFDRGG